MPEVELRADFDQDGRLSGSPAEYAARAAGHGAILGANVDRDGRRLADSARVGRPVQLDHTLPTKTGNDGDPIGLQAVVSAAAVARYISLTLRVSGDNADAIALIDDRSRVLQPARTAPGRVEFPLPLRRGIHAFRLEASRIPGSPLGQSNGALTVSVVGREAGGTESTVDEGRFLLARFIVLDDLAPAQALYICNLPDNVPSVSDVRAGLASVRPPVALREVGLADNMGDAWAQDQFQLGCIRVPGRTMRALLHMPRFLTNAQLGANQRNLAELVRTHFPSTDLGLIDDFWQRTVPLQHSGGVANLSLADSAAAFRSLHQVVSASEALREALDRLCAAARLLGISPPPPECANPPPRNTTVPGIRLQLPELHRRVEAVVRQLLNRAAPSQRPGLETLRNRVRQLVRNAERVLGVSGSGASAIFSLALGGTTFQVEGGDLATFSDAIEPIHDSLVYGGNIEAAPPTAAQPFGKVVVGESEDRPLDPPLRELFDSGAAVQPVVTVDSGWLKVGHVDELISFLPDRGAAEANVVFRASPEVALALLDKASWLYHSGLSIHHPDTNAPWRPLTLQRHRMSQGSHPLTRMFRGKLWLHQHPQATAPTEADEGTDPGQDQEIAAVLPPPQVYLRIVDWYSGLLSETLAPYYPDSTENMNYYRASLSAWEFTFFEGGTNQRIAEEKLKGLDETLAREFASFPIRRVPVLFDRAPRPDLSAISAFTPDLVNLQYVNGTVLIPNPFGPRMLPVDAATVIGEVLGEQGLSGLGGRVSPRYFRQQGLDLTEVWLNPSMNEGSVTTPFHNAHDLAEEFADGFGGKTLDEIELRIRQANRAAFDASGILRQGWRKLVIPEGTVDLFQAYTHALLDAQGLRPQWVDSWFYHVRFGEIHCGTNVLRSIEPARMPWWNRVPSAYPS